MTRKDYVLLATVLREAGDRAVERNSLTDAAVVVSIATAMADRLAADNPMFDRARFCAKAGVAAFISSTEAV